MGREGVGKIDGERFRVSTAIAGMNLDLHAAEDTATWGVSVGMEIREIDVRLAWHDATCPEAEECRSRELHSLEVSSIPIGILWSFLEKLRPSEVNQTIINNFDVDVAEACADAVVAKLNRLSTWDSIQKDLVEWTSLFSSLTTGQPEAKLLEEVEEFLEAETGTDQQLEEAADVVIVVATQLTYDGYTVEDLAQAVLQKLMVNIDRKWKLNDDLTISHVKDVSGKEES